jgi:predicted outer membrane protein
MLVANEQVGQERRASAHQEQEAARGERRASEQPVPARAIRGAKVDGSGADASATVNVHVHVVADRMQIQGRRDRPVGGIRIALSEPMKKRISAMVAGAALAMVACGLEEPPRSPEAPGTTPHPSQMDAPSVSAASNDLGAQWSLRAAGASTQVADLNGSAVRDAGLFTGLTNGQILEVTRTANVGEIQQAHMAHERSRDPRIQKLAAMMMHDQVDAETKGDALANKAGLNPDKSSASESLEDDANRATLALKTENGLEFDKDYVDTQVRAHQAVLDLLNDRLIPYSTSAGLSAYLNDVKVFVLTHLQHASELQQELAGSERSSAK